MALTALGMVMMVGPAGSTGPTGKLLWSNVNVSGPGLYFDATATACANGDLLVITSLGTEGGSTRAIARLHPDGTAAWSSSREPPPLSPARRVPVSPALFSPPPVLVLGVWGERARRTARDPIRPVGVCARAP